MFANVCLVVFFGQSIHPKERCDSGWWDSDSHMCREPRLNQWSGFGKLFAMNVQNNHSLTDFGCALYVMLNMLVICASGKKSQRLQPTWMPMMFRNQGHQPSEKSWLQSFWFLVSWCFYFRLECLGLCRCEGGKQDYVPDAAASEGGGRPSHKRVGSFLIQKTCVRLVFGLHSFSCFKLLSAHVLFESFKYT